MSDRRVGSVDAEARLLAETLRRVSAARPGHGDGPDERPGATGPALRLVGPDDDSAGAADPAGAEAHATCTSCPLCQAGAWGREHGPDILRSLADVVGLAAEGLRSFAASLEESGVADTGAHRASDGGPGAGRDGADVDEGERA